MTRARARENHRVSTDVVRRDRPTQCVERIIVARGMALAHALRCLRSVICCALCTLLLLCCAREKSVALIETAPPIAAPAAEPTSSTEPTSVANPTSAAQPTTIADTARPALNVQKWTIDGVTREALVAMPNASLVASTGSPVLFVFHGRGGTARQVRRSYDIEKLWPEAIVVYPQGLRTPGRIMDTAGKQTGWQVYADVVDNRDLKFFDAMLASMLADARAEANRVYSTGHSNGGGFSYLLWSVRHDALAAVAPSASAVPADMLTKPLSAMHIGGRNDSVVKFALQEATINAARACNQCTIEGTSVGSHGTMYGSRVNAPLLLWITDGKHAFDKSCVPPMVEFLRAQLRDASKMPTLR